nr:hypothetical protein GCM10025732_30470 [Glycomyces mayteni]
MTAPINDYFMETMPAAVPDLHSPSMLLANSTKGLPSRCSMHSPTPSPSSLTPEPESRSRSYMAVLLTALLSAIPVRRHWTGALD